MNNKNDVIIAYKGFDKDLKCRGFQFEVGKTYSVEGDVVPCENGFHACKSPQDVFEYYPPASRFCKVLLSGSVKYKDNKAASQSITILEEISLVDYITAISQSISDSCKKEGSNHTTDNYGVSSATGYQSASSATGHRSASSATGYRSASSATGYRSASSATGDQSASSATGHRSASSATGHRSASSATGNYGVSSATSEGGNNAVAVASGFKSKAKAGFGDWIVVAEHDENYRIINLKTAQAGVTEGIKPDTYYTLKNNEFVED